MKENLTQIYITAKELRDRLKISYSTVNYYTDIGLFSVAKKSGNRRIYDWQEVENRYEMISRLRSEGYPLGLIRKNIGAYAL